MRDLIVFLRGVNVGGHRKLPMAELRAVLAQNGFVDPRSYIQSGNLVIGTDAELPNVQLRLQDLIESHFGFRPDMTILTRGELADAIAQCPYSPDAVDPSRIHLFIHIGDPVSLSGLRAEGEDRARLQEGALAHYMETPDGMSVSKLAEKVTRRLKDRATARNLRTCLKMLDLAE